MAEDGKNEALSPAEQMGLTVWSFRSIRAVDIIRIGGDGCPLFGTTTSRSRLGETKHQKRWLGFKPTLRSSSHRRNSKPLAPIMEMQALLKVDHLCLCACASQS
jgi:hypothetical protein